jgi:hypothetical protein
MFNTSILSTIREWNSPTSEKETTPKKEGQVKYRNIEKIFNVDYEKENDFENIITNEKINTEKENFEKKEKERLVNLKELFDEKIVFTPIREIKKEEILSPVSKNLLSLYNKEENKMIDPNENLKEIIHTLNTAWSDQQKINLVKQISK